MHDVAKIARVSADVAIVTGGASGVGKATVEVLASRGIPVVAIDRAWRDEEPGPPGVQRIGGDVVADDTWSAALEAATRLGGPSMLVVCAAKNVVGTVLDVTAEDVRSVMEVNLIAAVKGIQASLPSMLTRRRGSIVAVASTNALYAEQGLVTYNTSKGALVQLIRSVAIDHAREGIRANAVCPGAIDTPFLREHVDTAPDPEALLAQKIGRIPSGRMLDPVDVARVIDFLLTDAAVGMNGASVLVDGGLTATYDFATTTPGVVMR
jgi:NAD(P)-dependent dehydrogenase (short-subunit alcohol dehydrogenase family)